jgi:uncharacterized protein
MTAPKPSKSPNAPLGENEIDELADWIDLLDERSDVPLSLESVDGFITALICGPREVAPDEFFPILLDRIDGLAGVFENEAEESRFMALFQRRWNEISRALDAPVENLADPRALAPLIMDWDGLLGELPPDDAVRLKAEGIPLHAQLWASGFLLAVEYWENDWALPQGSKDEAFVDEKLEPFYVLMAPEDELSPEELETSRTDHLALAIWGAYDLHEFWRDRGRATQKPN